MTPEMTHRTFSFKQYSLNTFSSLKIRNYRLYYIGQVISTSGTFMQSIAQAWLVLKLTDSGTALGVVTALQYLPILFLSPYGGLIADRLSKRTILYVTQSTLGVLALILGVLVATGWVTLWSVYLLAFCLGLVSTVDNPSRQSFVVEMVGEGELRNAVTLYSTLVNLARVIGPAIAAALIAAFGLAPCFIINGISYAAVVIMLLRMNPAELRASPPLARSRGQLRQGFQYMLSHPVLRSTLLMMAIIGTLTFEFQVSLPLIARFTFHGNASSYALLSSAMGIGAVAGGLFIAGQKAVSLDKLVRAALPFGLAVLAAAFMPSLQLTVVALVFAGATSIAFISLGNSLLQLTSDAQMRGRVMAFWSIAFLGSSTIGGPIVGWFGEFIGPRWGLAIGGLAALVAAALGWRALGRSQIRAKVGEG
jgi:MFS family permease